MNKRGGKRENSGRKKLEVPHIQIRLSLTKDECVKLKSLGGSKFVKAILAKDNNE